MSGICAVWRKAGADPAGAALASMADRLCLSAHDRTAHAVDGDAGVAVQARFPASQQLYRDARVLVACDADLLNEPELRAAVGLDDHVGPATLLAALYQRHDEPFVERLRGAFSVVVWDVAEQRMLAAVDRFAVKRLAWYDDGKSLVIASRVDAVRAAAGERPINPRAIANVVNFSANLGPETIFSGIRRLGPGAMVRATRHETRVVTYWDMQYAGDARASEDDLARQLDEVVDESVKAHCSGAAADTLGAFLSGGTDSSTVVGMMTRALGAPVNAFSIGFEEQPFNELEYAEIAAAKFGAAHHTYLVSARDCFGALPAIVDSFDEPFGNSSAIATYFCTRLAAAHGVTTLLAGDGGDELFGGNERYATEQIFAIYQAVPAYLRRGVIEPLSAIPLDVGLMRRARGYIRRAKLAGPERMFSFNFLRTYAADAVFTPEFLRALDDYDVLAIPAGHYARASASDHLDRLLYVDMKITLADNDLPKVTCMAELAGTQARFPFLDRHVAEFSTRLPARLKVKGFKKRYLFKRAFRGLLPAEIIQKKKHGFGIPVATWIKSDRQMRELARDTLGSSSFRDRGYFRPEIVEDLFRKHDVTESPYYGDILWTMLMLELWHRHSADRAAAVPA
jgi:asparagine synthase (glutamine-hydrolysing)